MAISADRRLHAAPKKSLWAVTDTVFFPKVTCTANKVALDGDQLSKRSAL